MDTATAVEPTVTVDRTLTVEAPEEAAAVEQDLLVEDVSIDGMCGVY